MSFGYDDVASGRKSGTTCWPLPDPSISAIRPDFVKVDTSKKLTNAVKAIGSHFLRIIDDIESQSKQTVSDIVVGKTYVGHHKKFKASRFDAGNHAMWTYEGVTSRWQTRYKPDGYDGMVVTVCFALDDVPSLFRVYEMDHQDLALKYEDLVCAWLRTKVSRRTTIQNEDSGGGGRRASKSHAGYVLYLAFRFKTRGSTKKASKAARADWYDDDETSSDDESPVRGKKATVRGKAPRKDSDDESSSDDDSSSDSDSSSDDDD